MSAGPRFSEMRLPREPTTVAPDGSAVRVLLALAGGSMAHFELAAGSVSRAVRHRTVEEIWYVVAGTGEMWRRDAQAEAVSALNPGTCKTIPVDTSFQFRSLGTMPLAVVAVTMPPWPGGDEAEFVAGCPGW